MEGGVKQPDGTEWPVITEEERTLYELLFYSQGPVDGYILGEGVRDLFLKSGLSLRVLSQIWNLADVSNDNVLNVHEFSLVMHLIRGLRKGLKAPPTLPRKLTPPKSRPPLALPPLTPRDREAYSNIFTALDLQGQGFLDGDCCRHVFEASELTSEVLAQVWDLCDVSRDGKLDVAEFCVACHLLRFLKTGHSLAGPVDVFTELPEKVDPQSLRARKRRVQQYEQHKQKLMSLKERRRQQVLQENKRLQLQQEKLDLLRQVHKVQKKRGQCPVTEEQFSDSVALHREHIDQLEEIVFRLKKEHEKVRQETVKIILAEQKLNTDIITIKKDTDELNKRLGTCHTHATKDPDPFHQLYEQRKEKRQGSTIKDLDKIEVSLPFTFNPFDPALPPNVLAQGALLFSGKGNNHGSRGGHWQSVMDRLAGFGEGFESALASLPGGSTEGEEEEDAVFREISVSMETERWLGYRWGREDEEGVLGLSGPDTEDLQEKLLTLRAELRKLNEPGTRLVFKNPDDYLARKRAKEEEEKKDRPRFQRRSVTDRRSVSGVEGAQSRVSADLSSPRTKERTPRDRHSYAERNEQVSQAVREYRQKRQSLHGLDSSLPASADSSASSSPRESRRTSGDPSRSTRTTITTQYGTDVPAREIPVSEVVREPPEGKPSAHSELIEISSASSSRPSVQEETSLSRVGSEQKVRESNGPDPAAIKPGVDVSATSVGRVSEEQRTVKGGAENGEKVQDKRSKNAREQKRSQNSFEEKQITKTEKEPRTQTEIIDKPSAETTVISIREQNVSIRQESRQADPVSPDPVPRPTDHVQRSTSSDSAPGISQTRPSSKKTRAPPPPRAGVTVTSPSPSSPEAVSPARQAPASRVATPAESKPSGPQIEQSRAVPVQSQTSPERPARPKRRKASSSASSSNPSSPREVQPPVQGGAVVTQVPVNNSRSDILLLTENACLEEEAPPAQGTVFIPTTKPGQKEKSSKTAPSSAQNSVPPLLLNSNGQSPVVPSQGVSPSESVKQKRRKGKAPEPPSPSPSAISSPRDAPVSPSPTPSPSASPRDAPTLSRSADITPAEAKQEKAERRKSSKTKAPPLPEQRRSNPAPTKTVPEPKAVFKVTQEPAPAVKSSPEPSIKVDTSSPPPELPVLKADPAETSTTKNGVELQDKKSANPAELTKDVVIVPDPADRGRLSETSSVNDSDTESLPPPPLPSSAPPPLPTLPPPSPLLLSRGEIVEEEVIEVREVSSAHSRPPPGDKMEDGVLLEFDSMLPDTLPDVADDSQKSMANLRAQFFGLNTAHKNSSNNGKGLADLDELGGHSGDSDLSSDERGVEGTFSPGDSGVVLSSLPTSPDDGDGRIQLLSYTTQPPSSDTSTTITVNSSSSSQRPQSLPVRDSSSTSSSGDSLLPASSATLVSPQDMAALSPRSREIFEKARHFADMVQKPRQEEEEGEGGEELSQTTLQDLEMERRAVISQSTVRRREVLSPPPAPEYLNGQEEGVVAVEQSAELSAAFREVREPVAPAEQSDSPRSQDSYVSEHGDGTEARWQGKADKVNLYSENVLQEPDSSEVVDRESIANLATTRRQWEAIFTSEPKDEPASKPKKNPPKWEVRMPYAEKTTTAGPATVSSHIEEEEEPESPPPPQPTTTHTPTPNMADTESAIEREIRLAVEREEMLRREQEERLRQLSLQAQHGVKGSSMESSTESELQPSFHELAEADRGSEFFVNDRVQQQEDSEREESLQRGYAHQKLNAASKPDSGATESIIEREIRLQREREAELALQRGGRGAPSAVSSEQSAQREQPSVPPQPVEEDDDDDEVEVIIQEIPCEEAISRYNHEGESRIAQELRELKEREEDVRKMRERMMKTSIGGAETSPQKPAPSPSVGSASKSPTTRETSAGVKSTLATPRVDKTPGPTVSFSRSTPASPCTDASPRAPKPETPIEREIRLSRERENELRRAKGLPELKPEPQRQESVEVADPEDTVVSPRYHHPPQPDSSMRRFASNRLQQEMQDQRKREMKLRQEGKIISTSEEHIQPHKYSEIVGQDHTDGSVVVKRNFKTPGRRNSNTSQDSTTSGENTPRSQTAAHTPRESSSGKKSKGTGAVSFSYREFAQTAESKIERELREMREREEELRKLRSGGADS